MNGRNSIRAFRVISLSGFDLHDFSRLYSLEDFLNFRHQGLQRLDSIIRRDKHNYRDGRIAQVLLIGQILIAGKKHVELALKQAKQFAIFLARPASFLNSHNIVVGHLALQFLRQTFID